MIELKIAFLDEEEEYLEQLSAYLIQKKENFFKVQTFCKMESFQKSAEKENFDAVVATYPFIDALTSVKLKTKVILLCEGSIPKHAAEIPAVSKYQSAEQLLAQISALFWQETFPEETMFPGTKAELIGIYSPTHQEHQMIFSMTMAQILAEHQKVLYLNLLQHSGFYSLTGVEAKEDIGDLLYGMMQEEHDFCAGLHRIRQTLLNFDYIPPVSNPEHLSEISKDLYERLFLSLKNKSGYDIIIIDFGAVFLGFAEIIPILGNLYCLEAEGSFGRCRMEEFLQYLEKESEAAKSHVKRLPVPKNLMHSEEVNPIEQSMYGEMGDYVRRYLYGGREVG